MPDFDDRYLLSAINLVREGGLDDAAHQLTELVNGQVWRDEVMANVRRNYETLVRSEVSTGALRFAVVGVLFSQTPLSPWNLDLRLVVLPAVPAVVDGNPISLGNAASPEYERADFAPTIFAPGELKLDPSPPPARGRSFLRDALAEIGPRIKAILAGAEPPSETPDPDVR